MNYRNILSVQKKILRIFFLFFLFSIGLVQAQVTVDFSLERSLYLAYEPLLVTVTIHNFSGNTLLLADEEHQPWLSFHIETEKGTPLSLNQKETEIAPVSLAPGETWSQQIDLTRFYPLGDFGSYRLSTVVYVPAAHRYFHSPVHVVEITEGHLLSQQKIGVPLSGEGSPENRTVSLLSHRCSDHAVLYLRIEDPDRGIVLCTYPLGRMITPSAPEMLFDKKNQIYILQHEAPGVFLYTHLDLKGKVIERELWRALPERPKLIVTSQGAVRVNGGTLLSSPKKARAF